MTQASCCLLLLRTRFQGSHTNSCWLAVRSHTRFWLLQDCAGSDDFPYFPSQLLPSASVWRRRWKDLGRGGFEVQQKGKLAGRWQQILCHMPDGKGNVIESVLWETGGSHLGREEKIQNQKKKKKEKERFPSSHLSSFPLKIKYFWCSTL